MNIYCEHTSSESCDKIYFYEEKLEKERIQKYVDEKVKKHNQLELTKKYIDDEVKKHIQLELTKKYIDDELKIILI